MEIIQELILGLLGKMKSQTVHTQSYNLIQSSKVPKSKPLTNLIIQLGLLAVDPVLISINHDKYSVDHPKIEQILALFMDLSVPSQFIDLFEL